jgi:very-short-patch-repair endonuclease
MREQVVKVDSEVAAIAARQHGVVTFTQLRRAGVSRSGVYRRVAVGRLHRVHRGVYAVGHRGLSQQGKWIAAVLACGDGAALSHRSAAELWICFHQPTARFTSRSRPPRAAEIAATACESTALAARHDLTTRCGIPVTTPARTVVDLRRCAQPATLRKAVREAEFRGLDLGDTPIDRTRSELERAFLRLCRRYRLPQPEVNVLVAGFTVDFLWRDHRLVVETDGYRAHRGRQAFEDDRERELALGLLGIRLRRFSDHQVNRRPADVAAAVRAALEDEARDGRRRGSRRNTTGDARALADPED